MYMDTFSRSFIKEALSHGWTKEAAEQSLQEWFRSDAYQNRLADRSPQLRKAQEESGQIADKVLQSHGLKKLYYKHKFKQSIKNVNKVADDGPVKQALSLLKEDHHKQVTQLIHDYGKNYEAGKFKGGHDDYNKILYHTHKIYEQEGEPGFHKILHAFGTASALSQKHLRNTRLVVHDENGKKQEVASLFKGL